jgi:hypothetical protein
MVLALGVGALGGWMGGRAEHWEIVRRMVTIDGFLRGFNARAGKIAQAERAMAPLPSKPEDMTELEILHAAAARGMLHSQQPRRTGE